MIVQRDVRFMIAVNTYKMHPDAQTKGRMRDEVGPEAMAQDEPPSGNFTLLLLPNIFGFNMQEKKWSMP